VRQACGAALLAFLLDYPLGGARLARHRGFLLANLGYEHAAGRLAVLDMLQARARPRSRLRRAHRALSERAPLLLCAAAPVDRGDRRPPAL